MENSNIEWTDHTFNPWWGCSKVSAGCKNCYAEAIDNHWNPTKPHWGPGSTRKPMSEAYWGKPIKWNATAQNEGVRRRVFCASMADVFEDDNTFAYESRQMIHDARLRLFNLIALTPSLDWLLLTKRPQNILPALKSIHAPLQMHDYLEVGNKDYLQSLMPCYDLLNSWLNGIPPLNVILGTSIENQYVLHDRATALFEVPANGYFFSMEPLLSSVNLSIPINNHKRGPASVLAINKVNWVIVGGESGHNARPMHPGWARSIRDQCKAANVPYFFKQWGEWLPCIQLGLGIKADDGSNRIWYHTPKNAHRFKHLNGQSYYLMGKKDAGNMLDGVIFNEFPIINI